MATTGLSNVDFAGIVKYKVNPDSHEYNGYDEEYGLIYTEFIALLTDQLQKAKKQIAELETERETFISRIEAIENNLK